MSEVFRPDVREVTRTDCSLMARMALSSEGFRQDVREANENRLQSGCECGTFVGRVPTGRQRSHKNRLCSQVVKMAILLEGFRQDFREVMRTDCSLIAKMALLSEEFRQDGREITRTECSHIAAV